jgi:signal transduction histidine kinase/CheY-like chemotaxis protein
VTPTAGAPLEIEIEIDETLAGGGEMGARMRAIDWSATPLGPVKSWPQSLKTCVRIVLTSRQPMFVWWGDALVNLYNDAYKSIVGGKHPQALGQPASVVWREVWEQVGPRAESAIRRNEGTYDEALLLVMERHGYQEETYYTFSYSPVPNDQGGTGGILCANTDDTRRILGERQLDLLRDLAARTADARTVSEACARSAESLAKNPRDVPFALIYLADAETRTLGLAGNVGIERGLAASPERVSLEGPSPWPFLEALRTHAPIVVRELNGLDPLPTGAWQRPPRQAVAVPLAASGQSGLAGVLVVGLNPFRLFDDDYRGFLGLAAGQIAAGIANAQAYEAEKKRAEALAELDRAKTAFFSNVSHEFRTPLTLILGPLEDSLKSGERALTGEALQSVHRNAMRLLKLVNSLLDFARIEAGRAQASHEATDLSVLTADLASAFRSAIERGGLRFEVECPPLPEPVWVDHEMWEKIVLNLLSNALKFTFAGSIRVSLTAQADRVVLTVRDTGTGIAAQELPHLFDRFHRVEGARSRTHEGTGIGLALVHELVRLQGGTVEVESTPGEGSTFRVLLPKGSSYLPPERIGTRRTVVSGATGASPYVEEALRWLPGNEDVEHPSLGGNERGDGELRDAPAHAGPRILLVDDNADMREYVRRLLSERWRVEAVRDGAEALDAALRAPPDLVLTDVMMPNLDGFGLLRALRADDRTRAVPVVMLSARAGEESRVEGLEAGVDDYLPKPFSARELIARVATHLQIGSLRSAAEKEREKLRDLFMQAPVPVAVLVGPEHRYEVANPAYCEMVGRPHLEGKSIREAFPEIGEHEVIATLDRVLRTGQALRVTELNVPIRRGRAAGLEGAYFNFVAHPLRSSSAEVSGVMVVATEVTEQVLARRHIDSLRASAESANRAKDEFLAMLGHELRNPLAPIVTALHLMKLRGGGAMEKERSVIERQVTHLTRLVDDLLDVSRITRGKIELDRQQVEAAEVIAKAIELSSPVLEQRQHHLVLSVASRGLAVHGDPTRLAQVFSNLLTNAAKYTPPGGHIKVAACCEAGRIVLSVKDDGIGIDPEVLPRVFELFVQERRTLERSEGGLGLGLAIVRNLVAMHGGTVAARSEGRGRGSEFVVELPAAARQDPLARNGTAGSSEPSLAPSGRRILVVDDNADAAQLLAETLRAVGHVTRVAHDGPAALRIASEFRPDAALLDIGLPVMDGYELARRLREQLGDVQLVAITGYGQAPDKERAIDAGFDEHLVKPVQFERLHAVLNERPSKVG